MVWLRRCIQKPEIFFAVIALVFGILLCFLIPVGSGFDEITHLARVWETSGGAIIPNQKFSQGPYFPMAFTEVSYRNRFFYTPVGDDYFQKYGGTRIDWNNFTDHKTRSVYFPIFYLPQAFIVGLLARALDAPVLWIYYLCRLAELLGYVLMVYLAIRRIPYGKWIVAYLALAPMALYQAGTITTDPYTNGISLLFIAWVLYLARVERITPKQIGILLAVTLLLFSAKLNTIFLVLLLVLLPARKFPSRRAFWLFWGGVIALFAVVVIGWNLLVYSSFYMNVPGYGLFAQLQYILSHPFAYLGTFAGDLALHAQTYLIEWIGVYAYSAGHVPPVVYILYGVGLALVWLLDAAPERAPVGKERAALLGSAVLGFVFTITIMYLVNSRVGAPNIEGVQGRYFILVAPLLFLGLSLPRPVLAGRIGLPAPAALALAAGALPALIAYCAGIYLSFYVVCGTSYYTPGLCYLPQYKNWAPNASFSAPVTEQVTLSQTFTPACASLESVRVWSRLDAAGDGSTSIAVRDAASGALLAESSVQNRSAPDQDWLEVTFPAAAVTPGGQYAIEIRAPGADTAGALAFGMTERREYTDGAFSINGAPVSYDLIFQYGCTVR